MQTRSEQHSQGQIVVSAALLLTVLVSFMGLAVDVGYMVDYRRRMTAAADGAAVAAAWEVKRNSNADAVTAARRAATDNGFTHGTKGITVTVNRPPLSGDYVGKKRYVEVLIKQPRPTFFLRVLNIKSTTVAARAVAGSEEGIGCIYVLDQKADQAFVASGAASVNAPTCSIYVNSTSSRAMVVSGGACVTAQSINITGSGSVRCASPNPLVRVPPVADPFADLQAPPMTGCTYSSTVSISGRKTALSPGIYCGGIVLSGGASVTFNPGLYRIKNGLTISASAASGTGVTFYIDSGKTTISGGTSVVQFSAPTSGPWEGILFFQNRTNVSKATFSGGGSLKLEGVLYFPSALMEYSGGTANGTNYTVIVSRTLKFTGPSALNGYYAGLGTGDPVKKPTLVE